MTKTFFYCPSCRIKVQAEILEIQEKNGKKYAKGECACGSNLSVILPSSFKIENQPYDEEIENTKIQKLKEERSKLDEKIIAETFKEKVNTNPLLQENKVSAVNSSIHAFYKTITIAFFLLILGSIIFFGYLIYEGKLNGIIQSTINPIFNLNSTTENNFQNTFDNQVNNEYQNNYTIINNVKICNNQTC